MSKIVEEVLAANTAYAASFGDKGTLPMPPGRHFAILTSMDARLDPAKYGGLSEGDAHVIRNAGGRASDDAIRSLVNSYKLLGTREWFVIHHTNCGMETFTDEVMRGHRRPGQECLRGCATHQDTPTGPAGYSHLWVHLRHKDRTSDRSARSHETRQGSVRESSPAVERTHGRRHRRSL